MAGFDDTACGGERSQALVEAGGTNAANPAQFGYRHLPIGVCECGGDAVVERARATNAGKYGALSMDAGGVEVGWQLDGDIFAMNWTERNGPPVSPPERRGFGSTVLDAMAKRTVQGEVELDYAPSGLGWRLTRPAANALEPWN